MMKTTLGVLAGIIVGAIGMELLNKTNPELVAKIESKIKEGVECMKSSIKKCESVEEAAPEKT